MPDTTSIVIDSSGSRSSLTRMATIGSRTDPWLPDNGPASYITLGLAVLRPLPMKRRRSVSYEDSPATMPPWAAMRRDIQGEDSPADRGRLGHRMGRRGAA